MLFDPSHEQSLDGLEARLRRAHSITPGLLTEFVAQAGVRLAAMGTPAGADLDRLIAAGAFTDAVLALVKLELPQWRLRRLICDDGEWLGTLSRQPSLPLGLDETAEASHEYMVVAILLACLQARRAASAIAANVTAVPQVRSDPGYAVRCDNFA